MCLLKFPSHFSKLKWVRNLNHWCAKNKPSKNIYICSQETNNKHNVANQKHTEWGEGKQWRGEMCGPGGTGDSMAPWVWSLLHGSTWCPGAEFKSIMAVAASMSDSGRGENMHDGQSWGVTVRPHGILSSSWRDLTGFQAIRFYPAEELKHEKNPSASAPLWRKCGLNPSAPETGNQGFVMSKVALIPHCAPQ